MLTDHFAQPVPRGWKPNVRSAVLHVISLAHASIVCARGWAAKTGGSIATLKAQIERLRHEVMLLREEVRIKDTRMARTAPQRRPHYPPTERMAILELRAARGWSLAQTARAFLITSATISEWLQRIDEPGLNPLVELPEPVNKFPQLVRYLVRRLRTLCPTLGKVKLAEALARTGLHLSATTVGRMLRSTHAGPPQTDEPPAKSRIVTAKRPNHVWHVDLTTVPIGSGFWTTWLPQALPQCWPFCWWVAAAVDHFSRRVMGFAAFPTQPTSEAIRAFLGRTVAANHAAPKHLICDQGSQFWCAGFKSWCKRRGIRPRFGAVGKQGSIAIVERFIRTLKDCCTRRLLVVPLRRAAFLRELALFAQWYNVHRPHMSLGGRTPEEVYRHLFPAHRKPRYEPRARWPRGSHCAAPWALVRGSPGARVELHVAYLAGRKHLPIVTVRRAA
jgi:putative transposase